MTKRITQTSTVVVPATVAHVLDGAAPAPAKAAVAAEGKDEAEKVVVAAKADDEAPVVETVMAAAAPAPLAMVDAAALPAAAAAAAAAQASEGDDGSDATPYIVGGVLLVGGIVAVAASGGGNGSTPTPTPPANTAPTITSGTTATAAENVPTTTTVYTAAATDAQAQTITYSLGGADAALFAINASTGAVTFRASPDFEATPTKTTFTFTVTATDSAGLASTAQTVTLTLTNVNEAPTFAAATRTTTLAENVAAGTVVVTAGGATDPDANTTLTYSLTGTDAALFTINATTGAVSLIASPNFEAKSSYSFNIVASDGTNTATQANTLTITNVNEAPTFATATRTTTVAENIAAGTVVVAAGGATDPDANTTLTYSLTGTDAGLFTINATTGAVTLTGSPNFEAKSSYSFNIVASDGTLSTSQANTLTVTDVNEAPVFTSGATATVAENAATTTVVYTAAATDPDAGSTVRYSLGGTDASAFAINATTGVVTLVASANFEAKSSYSINVIATDNGNPALTTTQAVTVSVTDVNEAPVFAAATRTAAIDENVAIGTVVPGSATATDVDANSTIRYSLSGADAASFTINATTGVVSLAVSPDFETKAVYNFNVVATDNGTPGLTATQAVTLNINDLPEGVVLVGTQNLSALAGNIQYLESAGTANTSTITSFTAGDTITVDVATSNYSFSNNGADLIIQYANGAIVNQITLVGAVAPTAVIFNEASAEAAVGSNFFLQSGQTVTPPPPPPPSASVTIDGSGATATYSAAAAATTFTENAGAANTTSITGFTTDDRIVVQGATSGYSFTNNGADLIIQFANGAIVNQITLVNAVNPTAVVFNEASAEAALGADFFRYA